MPWSDVVLLYRQMMRESKRFPNYMFRTYALRRVRDAFHENRNVTDAAVIDKLVHDAHTNLQVIRRQVIIGNLYKGKPFAIESIGKEKGVPNR